MSVFGGGEAQYVITVDSEGVAEVAEALGDAFDDAAGRARRGVRGIDLALEQIRRRMRATGRSAGKDFGDQIAAGLRSSSSAVQRAALNALAATQKAAAQQAAAQARVAVAQQTAAARAAAQQVRGQQQQAAQQARAATQAAAQQARIQVAQTVAAGKQQAAVAQGVAQQQVIAARVAGQQRVAITRFFLDTLSRLERGFGRAVIGIAQTSVGAVRRVFAGTVGSLQRSFAERRSVITRETRSEIHIFQNAARQVQAIQQQTRQGVLGGLRGGALLGGIGAGLGVGSLLTSGFQRAADIENIQKRLNVLLNNNTFAARALFLQLAAFARTTAFDLTGVSDLASRLLAVGRTTDQILPDIRALSGAITLVGGTTDDLNGIARAIGQIGSLGKLTAEEMNQISERLPGLNITELFTKGLGFESTAAFVEAREAGEITADVAIEAFFNAMRGDPRFAQALAEGANSFSNLKANAIEAFQDVGAAIVERFEGPIKRSLSAAIAGFSGLASFIRGGELTGGLELLRVVLGKVAIALGAVVALKGAVEVFQLLGKGFALLLTPAGLLATALTAVGAGFLFLFQRSERFRSIVLDLRDAAFRFGKALFDQVVGGLRAARDALDPLIRPLLAFKDRLIGIATAVQTAFRQGGITAAFAVLRRNIGDLARDLFAASKPLRERIGDILGSARDLALSLRDRIVAAFRSIDFGAIIRSELGQAVGAGAIGALLGGIIGGGPIGAVLGAGLGVAFARFVIPAIRRAIDGIDVGRLFGRFLDGVREVARRIALILTDRRTLLGVAGIAAAAAAIAVQFVSGFVSGVLSNLDDIAAAGRRIIEALFDAPPIVQAAAAFLLIFRRQLVSGFRSIGKDAGTEAARGVAEGATQQSAVNGIISRLRPKFLVAGQALGAALSLGMAAALSGSAFGEAESNIDRVAGLAGSAASAVSAFTTATALSGGNVAVGAGAAAASLAISGLTAVMAANAKAAKANEDAVKGLADALIDAGKAGRDTAPEIATFIDDALKGLSVDTKEALVKAGFNADEFTRLLLADAEKGLADSGQGSARKYLDGFIAGLKPSGAGAENALKFLVGDTATKATGLFRGREEARKAAEEIEDELLPVGKKIQGAFREANAELALMGHGTGTLNLANFLGDVVDRAKDASRELRNARRERQELFRQEQQAKLETALAAIRDRAHEAGDAAEEARRKLQELLTPKTPDVLLETAQAGAAVPGLAEQVEEALAQGADSGLGKANLTLALDDFGTQVSEAVTAAVGDPAALAGVRWDLTSIIANAGVSEEAKAQLLKALDDAITLAGSPEALELKAKMDAESAKAAGLAARAAATESAVAAGAIPVAAAADIATAVASGTQIVTTADRIVQGAPISVISAADTPTAATSGSDIWTAANDAVQRSPILIDNISADTDGAFGVGRDIALGIKRGISANSGAVQAEANRMAQIAINAARETLRTGSPSKVFMGIGQDVVDGLVEGIESSSSGAVSAIANVVSAMLEAMSGLAGSVRSGVGELFTGLFDQFRIRGGGVTQGAIGGLTLALGGVAEQVAQNARELFEAASKPFGERSLAERLIVGESFTSLNLGDEFGVANRSAISAAVDQIREVGAALLEQGFSAQDTAKKMLAYRSQLLLTAVQAGLAAKDVDALINSLGLSTSNLNTFVAEAARLRAIVNEAQTQAKAPTPPPPLTTGPNPVQQFIDIDMNLPTGDPQANALAVVNRLALSLR